MTMHKLAIEVCKREGKKKQVDIAQVKEVLNVLVTIEAESLNRGEIESPVLTPLGDAANKLARSLRKKPAKKKTK